MTKLLKKNLSNLPLCLDILFFIILGSIPRLLLLFNSNAGIESDEAIVGLMGMHILEGREIPSFYYGQAYMGSLEALFAALYFKLFGINNWSLKLVPFSFSLVLIAFTYILGHLYGGKLSARISTLYVALGPSPLIIWSLKARGGFIETLVLGSLALIFTYKFTASIIKYDNISERDALKFIALLGLTLGLGWWTNNQIVFFLAPIGVHFLITSRNILLKNIKLWGSIVGVGTLSFLLGGLPFWLYNISSRPKWESFEVLFGKTAGGSALQYFSDFWSIAIPIILGAMQFWSSNELYNNSISLCYLAVAICTLPTILRLFYRSKVNANELALLILPMVLFLVFTPTIFSLSSFGWLSRAPRYLLPTYSVLPIILGISAHIVFHEAENARLISVLRSLFTIFFIFLIGNNLASNYIGGKVADEGQPMVYDGKRVAASHQALYSWLRERNCTHIRTNYWIGYRTAFETKEEITFSRFGRPSSLRIPAYEEQDAISSLKCTPPYVVVDSELDGLTKWLKITGQNYKIDKVENYWIISEVKYVQGEGKKLDLNANVLNSRVFIPPNNTETSDLAKDLKRLYDNDFDERWGTSRSQLSGMAIEFDFKRPINLSRLKLSFGKNVQDAPTALMISSYSPQGARVNIFDMRGSRMNRDLEEKEFGGLPSAWDIRFSPLTTKTLRLELTEDSLIFDWSMVEIEAFEQLY